MSGGELEEIGIIFTKIICLGTGLAGYRDLMQTVLMGYWSISGVEVVLFVYGFCMYFLYEYVH